MINSRRIASFILSLIGFSPLCCQAVLMDPTQPADYNSPVTSGVPLLSAIITSSDDRLAVINGHILHEGDAFLDGKITHINTHTVDIESAEGRVTLTLGANPSKN